MTARTRWLAALLAVVFVLGTVAPASAQWRRHRRAQRTYVRPHPSFGLGFSVSAWQPSDIDETDALVQGQMRFFLNDRWVVQPEVGFWEHEDLAVDENGFIVPVSARDIPIGVNLVYLHPVGYRTGIYLGGGASLHNWRAEQEDPNGFVERLDDSGLGGQVLGGLETRLSRGATIVFEGRYVVGEIDDFDQTGLPLDFSGPSIGVGLNFYFP